MWGSGKVEEASGGGVPICLNLQPQLKLVPVKFSIVTPSLNQSAYLPECVGSVRGQVRQETGDRSQEIQIRGQVSGDRGEGGADSGPVTPDSFAVEHLIQDGESADGTVRWLEDHSTRFNEEPSALGGTKNQEQSYSFSFVSEKDGGQTEAINRGWAKATGDVFSYLCADDYLLPGTLARVAEVFAEHPEVDVVYGDYAFLEGDSGWLRRKTVGAFSWERLQRDNFLSQPATFIRRRVYERHGPLDASLRYCMDHEYWLRIGKDAVWHYLPEVLAVQRLHADSKTGSQLVRAWEETAVMAERYGLGPRFRAKAQRMRLYGARCYAVRRGLYGFLGRWM